MTKKHAIERIRHELKRRTLTVETVERLTPRMIRVGLRSDELVDFVSASPDDHVKLFFPIEGEEDEAMRDYTPRAHDRTRGTLTIDFAIHDDGPATRWASAAKPGDTLAIGGPRSSLVVADDFDWVLLVGDESALPSIGRRVEELRAGVPVTTVVVVQDAGERQTFATRADWRPVWVERTSVGDDDAATLRAAVAALVFPPGEGFVSIAAENSVARALRSYLVGERGHPPAHLKAAAYWKRGVADAHDDLDD